MLHEYLEKSGLPVVATEIVDDAGSFRGALKRFRDAGFSSAVIKAAVGASGIGMRKIDLATEIDQIESLIPEYYFYEGACLVQGWLRPGEFGVKQIRSPSVQLFLDDNSIAQYDLNRTNPESCQYS